MKKQECIDHLQSKNVAHDPNMSAVELKATVRRHIGKNAKIEVVQIAEEAGHKVCFAPPRHSDFQPVELMWARIQGNVGCQHSNESTLQLVHQRPMAEFKALEEDGHKAVSGMIEKCSSVAQKFCDKMPADNEADAANEEEEGDADDGNGNAGDSGNEGGDEGDIFLEGVGQVASIQWCFCTANAGPMLLLFWVTWCTSQPHWTPQTGSRMVPCFNRSLPHTHRVASDACFSCKSLFHLWWRPL